MAETVIFPLSEETGLRILAVLERIARAMEGTTQETGASVEDDHLVLPGASVEDGYLVTQATTDDGYLSF